MDGRVAAIASEACAVLGVQRSVAFRIAGTDDSVPAPITWGLLRPIVILPPRAATWSPDCLRAAFLHELSHIQRRDWATQLMGRIVCALFWFHPLVWIAAWQARAEAENACDDCVIRAGIKPADYAERLVEVVRSMPAQTQRKAMAIAMAQPSEIERRLGSVLARHRNRCPLSARQALAGIAAAAAFLLPLAAITPLATAQASEQKDGTDYPLSAPQSKTPSSGGQQEAGTSSDVSNLRFLAGLTKVTGPGVVVTLNDSKIRHRDSPMAVQMAGIIHDTDILQTVNELRAAGAEAIAVNDQRLIATTPIRCAGPLIYVNNVPQTPPYVIRAIGDTSTLEAAMRLPQGICDTMRSMDPKMIRMDRAANLFIPAYDGTTVHRYAHVAPN